MKGFTPLGFWNLGILKWINLFSKENCETLSMSKYIDDVIVIYGNDIFFPVSYLF